MIEWFSIECPAQVIRRLLCFCLTTLCDWLSRHFLNQLEAKPKPTVPRSHEFSHAWHRLHEF